MSTILTISANCESGNNVSVSYKDSVGSGIFPLKHGESQKLPVDGYTEISVNEIGMKVTA